MNFLPAYNLDPLKHNTKYIYGEAAKNLLYPNSTSFRQKRKNLLSLESKLPVIQYLFIKALVKTNGKMKKYYIIRPVEEPISKEELRFYARKHATQSSPIWEWECAYCTFNKEELCEKATVPSPKTELLKIFHRI